MSNVTGGTITVRIQGQDVGLSDLLTRLNSQMQTSGNTARTYASQMAQINPALKSADAELARYAQSLASVARAQGDTAGSQRLLAQALQQITPATTSANQVMLQLQNSINQADNAGQTSTQTWRSMAAGLTTLVGAYFVATRVAQNFAEVIGAGNELEKTLTTFKVLSGSAQDYEKNLNIARQQQDRFGGSLNDTVEGMSEFANLSHRTGIEVDKLTNLARALATVDPAQGFKGASIALKEFLSGDNVTSLSRRFEIPREALNSIQKLTDKKEQFIALTEALKQFGISEELVTAQSSTTAVSFDKLGGAAADVKASLGQLLAVLAKPLAEKFTADIDKTRNELEKLILLFNQGDKIADFQKRVFGATATAGFDAYLAKLNEINGQLPFFAQKLQPLTEAQFNFAQGLIQTGISAEAAFSKVEAFSPLMERVNTLFTDNYILMQNSVSAVDAFSEATVRAAAANSEGAVFAEQVAIAVANHTISLQDGITALNQFATAMEAKAAADAASKASTDLAASATDLFTQKLTEEAAQKLASQTAGDALKLTQEQLYTAALNAASGMGATAQSAASLAGQFGITTSAAYGLIAALSQLEVAKAKQALGVQRGGANEREDRLGTNQDIIARAKDAELREKLAKAQRDNALAAATAAEKVGLEKDALARLNKGSVEYEVQLGKVQAAERALAAEQERKRKKNSGAPKLTPNEKINTKLLDDQDKFNDKFEDAEQKHWDKVADIYAKFNEEQQKQFAKNEVSKRRSRADFYSGLQDAPPGVNTQKFAAQYEEAFAKAQEIAQSGKAKLANEFLELRQRQIEEMKSLDEEAAKIIEGQKEGKISKKDAENQLAFLAGRKKLIEDAQAEEQKLLLANGDDNLNKLNEQLTAEEKAYNDQVDSIALSQERKADAVVKHAERSKIAVSEENKVLAENEARYRRIAQLNGGQVPAAQKTAVTQPVTNAGTENKPVNVEASTPIPVVTTDSLLVRQSELFIVHDADVMSAIGDMAARLEGKLGDIVAAVNSAKQDISSAVNSVKEAVGKIKVSSPSVVGA